MVTYNIDNIKEDRRLLKVCTAIRNIGVPDVLLMQEVHSQHAASFLAGNLEMPYVQYKDYAHHQAGLAVLSRRPLNKVKIHYFSSSHYGYGALAAEIKIGNRKLLICSVHLDRIPQVNSRRRVSAFTTLRVFKKELLDDTVRSRSVDELLKWLSGFDVDSIVIGGDFNTFPFSKPIRMMTKQYDDALWPKISYFSGTYMDLNHPLKPLNPRSDYIFYSPGVKCIKAEVVKTGPSDHYPVKAVFGLGG